MTNAKRRKSKYQDWLTEGGLARLGGWAREGLTDEEISKKVGISRSTLSQWKKKYEVIADTLKKGKEVVDMQVEDSLLRRALGFDYEETETLITEDANGNQTKRVKKYKKHALPDTTAIIYWLKNRKPDQWRNITSLDREKASLELEKIRLSNQKEAALIAILEDQIEKAEGKSTPFEGLIKDLLRVVDDD